MSQRCEFTSPEKHSIDSVVCLCLLTYLTGRHDCLSSCFISAKALVWLSEEPLLHSELECQPLKDPETSVTRFIGSKSPFMIVRYHSFACASPWGHIKAPNNALRRNIAPGNVLECQLLWCRAAEQEQPQPQETLGYDQPLRCWEKLFLVAAVQTCRRTTEPLRRQHYASSNQNGDRVLQSADLFSYLHPKTPM